MEWYTRFLHFNPFNPFDALTPHMFTRAATAGHATAQFNLGACYANGSGVAHDDILAFFWIEQSAVQGHGDAQCEVRPNNPHNPNNPHDTLITLITLMTLIILRTLRTLRTLITLISLITLIT